MKNLCLCKQCGRSYIYNGHNSKDYCDKHRHQLKTFGKFLDSNPRTKYDPNEFRFKGDKVEFDVYRPITGTVIGTYTIDAEDYPLVSKYKWSKNNTGYATTHIDGKNVMLHRLLMKPKDGQMVDHIDVDITNNCKSNLRVCNNSLNQQNRRGYNKYSVKGIELTRSNKWSAYFRNNNKQYHSQGYDTKEEAAFARFLLEQLFGEAILTQFNQEYIDKLSSEQKEYVINTIQAKFCK